MIFSKGEKMRVKLFEFNAYNGNYMEIERIINTFTERVEVIDIKQNFVKGERYNDIYLYITVLYK